MAGPWPALYLDEAEAVIASDLHIGLEDQRELMGIHIPRTTFPQILEQVLTPIKHYNAKRIFLLGDVKHEFGRPSEPEWWGVKKLVKSIREIGCEPEVVRGNHDNYIISVLSDLGVKVHDPTLSLTDSECVLMHGHEALSALEIIRPRILIMGHEHPSIAIRDDLGVRHRYKIFLSGQLDALHVIVLPSSSPFAFGSNMNEISPKHRLSPILKNRDLSEMIPYLLEIGITVKEFPKMKYF